LPLTPEKFDSLLQWLDANRDAAGRKYVTIQVGLVRIFSLKGFSDAESLADETINRVADRLEEIAPTYTGNPANYFRGVARNIILEAGRRREVATDEPPERPVKVSEVGDEYNCLLKCLRFFPADKRDMVLDYHAYEGSDKISNHQTMADELGISVSNLRVRVHRAKVQLEACVRECMKALQGKRNPS
jgi:DNA-directed RNA polymerase specialized sigma24 family protein